MLIPFESLVSKYKLKINGILHVGAHECEELEMYKSCGIENIVWIDAIPEKVEKSKTMFPDQRIYQAIISDVDEKDVVFHITNNYQSSSLLNLKKHSEFYPHIVYVQELHGKTIRLDTFLEKNNLFDFKFNFINLDIQGTELQALKSLGKYLDNVNYVYLEINEEELYEGCALFPEVEKFLNDYRLFCVEKSMTGQKWGDAFFIRMF